MGYKFYVSELVLLLLGVSFSVFLGLNFIRLGASNSYVYGLVFIRLEVSFFKV